MADPEFGDLPASFQQPKVSQPGTDYRVGLGNFAASRTDTDHHDDDAPKDYLILAIVTAILFNPFCGIIAVVASLSSRQAVKDNNLDRARSHGVVSLGLSLSSIVMTAVALLIFIAWIIVAINPSTPWARGMYGI